MTEELDVYTYESRCHHTPCSSEHETLAEAVRSAWADLWTDQAWPGRILNGQDVLWEQSGPLKTSDSLEKFAKASGIELPDV